ncbi:MFS transporter [Streptomyces atroolivaceus]|uniref:MFS transporter n=1 Tax=Streptomyces atroolivaceus TaxID=66869 RepID=A0ABV9V7N6_STRAZ|nr:MFS transporter [Streptomyces atroolivaceus]
MPAVTPALAVPARSPVAGWLGVVSVMVGIFSLVTTEILPIGLLTPIGATFGISDGGAGLMMTVPGVLAAVAAPVVTVVTRRIDRRVMLCALMLLLTVADFLAAAAPAYWVMISSRVLVGLAIGAFWSIGAGIAPRLVPPHQVGRATAVIFSAVPLGSVIGVPLGVLLGDAAGWRTAFTAMGILTSVVCGALVVLMPPLPPESTTGLGVLTGLIGVARIRAGLLVTFLVVLAHFGAYTYVTPFLEQETHAGPRFVTVVLLVYGTAGVVGNFAAGALVRRSLRATFGVAAGMTAASTLLLPVIGTAEGGAVVLLIVWGLAYGAVPVCSQMWFLTSAPRTPEAASVLFTSSFQATIALGALAGGVVVDAVSPAAVMLLGGATAALAPVLLRVTGGPYGRPYP